MSRDAGPPLRERDFSLPLHFLQRQNDRSCLHSNHELPQENVEEEGQGTSHSKEVHHPDGVGHPGHRVGGERPREDIKDNSDRDQQCRNN